MNNSNYLVYYDLDKHTVDIKPEPNQLSQYNSYKNGQFSTFSNQEVKTEIPFYSMSASGRENYGYNQHGQRDMKNNFGFDVQKSFSNFVQNSNGQTNFPHYQRSAFHHLPKDIPGQVQSSSWKSFNNNNQHHSSFEECFGLHSSSGFMDKRTSWNQYGFHDHFSSSKEPEIKIKQESIYSYNQIQMTKNNFDGWQQWSNTHKSTGSSQSDELRSADGQVNWDGMVNDVIIEEAVNLVLPIIENKEVMMINK